MPNLNYIGYADYRVSITDGERKLHEILQTVVNEGEKKKLKINGKKTKFIVVNMRILNWKIKKTSKQTNLKRFNRRKMHE